MFHDNGNGNNGDNSNKDLKVYNNNMKQRCKILIVLDLKHLNGISHTITQCLNQVFSRSAK